MTDAFPTNIFLFLNGEMSIEDFETWVYGDYERLAVEFGEDAALFLVEFNYKCSSSAYELEKFLRSIVGIEVFELWRVVRCLSNITARSSKAADSILMTYDFYCSGYEFMRDIGLIYGLCLQVPTAFNKDSWDDLTLNEKSKLTEMMYPGVEGEAQKIICWLTDGSITLHGKMEDGRYSYEDHRNNK